ncbi:hypothetical protein [Pectinatus frisingensis]|uniref:hypothetical protein n=1 Tax=Pectinatus frisingensis TaxID=865 RepID=UPI0018C5C8A3|nr:hypothetical protein [Pectinatus frisingensis]
MKLQVLVSVINSNIDEVCNNLNIKTDAIIINQTSYNSYEEKYRCNGRNFIKCYSFKEHGIGISRNNALLRAQSDICVIADDDVRYVDNYEKIIIEAYNNYADADMIVFNVPSLNINRTDYFIRENGRVHLYNCLRYGAFRFTFRTTSIKKANIFFSLLFGGGSKYGSGEDSLFILECVRRGLKVYCNKNVIGTVRQNKSTWFEGYNKKYIFDKGALVEAGFGGMMRYIVFLYMLYKLHKQTKFEYKKIWELLLAGGNDFRNCVK